MSGKKIALIVGASSGVLAIVLVALFDTQNPISIRGAVLALDPDPAKELPIEDAEVTVIDGPPALAVRSDASGSFSIPLGRRVRLGFPVTLRFRHPNYQSLDLSGVGEDKLYIAHLTPSAGGTLARVDGPEVRITNVVAKYSINTTTVVNIGSAVKTFQVVNTGNVPCNGQRPCSPDGKWKAALGSAVIDAGPGNEFHNGRASCIAGPCPFTRTEDNNSNLSRDSRTLRVSALNWSDTATFLLEAEVYKSVVSDVLRRSYPVIFDRALTFSLPASAEGVSIEAELDRALIVFPLGPTLFLTWANCQLRVNKDQTKIFRCELKPGYRF
ncbi:MAG TPA: carboxypeptidase-like regulatory domain-containing protein [Candidatus Acidoferrales bacterium]|nr:carboxypeptidase-like regulatory domain-containing protein [Candidatus Acidoferrales bacterium]